MARAPAPLTVATRVALAALLALAASLAAPAHATAPRLEWRTLVTAHFRIHYHEGLRPLAVRLAPIAEHALVGLSAKLAHLPEDPIHVVLTDETDSPNGFAQVLPYNLITLFAAVPEPASALGDFDDYWRMLLTHELAHVVHLDTIGGIPAAVNRVIGKQLSPNQVQPRWWIEGLATWLESDLSGAGRIRSSLFEMILRAQVMAGELPELDEVSTFTRPFPGGNSPYLYGGRFLDWVARRYGSEAVAEMSIRYGSRLIPYGLSIVTTEVLGLDVPTLWADWQAEEATRARALLAVIERERAAPVLVATGLAEDLRAPRLARDGTFVIFEAPRDDDPVLAFRRELGAITGTTTWRVPEPYLRVRSPSGEGAFTEDGRYVAVVDDVFRQRFSYRELEIIDLRTGLRRRRTEGARISDPDVRDGRIVAVASRHGRTWLVTLSIDGEDTPRLLHDPGPERFVFGPRWSPDGSQVAASILDTDGTRGLVLVDAASGALTRLTRTTAIDNAPAWTPDGRALLFSSDRGGVFDIHRLDLGSGELVRLTTERVGAFDPTVDARGETLIYRAGTNRGTELRRASLGELTPRAVRPAIPRPTATASTAFASVDEEPYQAWETLLPRRIRGSAGLSSAGLGATLELDGSDVVGLHNWGLAIGYSPEVGRLSYSAAYTNRMMWTPFRLSSFLGTDLATGAFVASDRRYDQRSSVWTLRFNLDVPISSWDLSSGFSLGYGVEIRRPVDPIPLDPFQREPRAPGSLVLAPLSLSFRVSNVRGFEDSISSARGTAFDIGTTVYHPSLGSDLQVIEATTHLTHFVSLPWARHHVLATRLSAGISAGPTGNRSTFGIGGLDVRNIISDAIDNRTASTDVIRGYRPGARRGPAFWQATAEYRLPLVDITQGIETIPAFADRLHLALFTDFGDTPQETLRFEDAAASVGAELRLDLVFGYFVPIRVRLGYARGLTEDGIHDVFLVLGGGF